MYYKNSNDELYFEPETETIDALGLVAITEVEFNQKVLEFQNKLNKVSSITKLQCKKQAVSEGLWDALKSAITSDADVQEDWDLALELDINDPSVQAMGVAMSKTPEELQTFFNSAALL